MHLILTGATGTCGSAALQYCLREPAITRISILSRRPVLQAQGHEKAHVVIQEDFEKYPQETLEQLKGAQACIWALGISQTEVTKEQYTKITYDYTMAAAKAFGTLSSPFKFVYVSGEGADQTEASGQIFAKVKGRVEKHLLELGEKEPSLKIYAARPGLIDPEGNNLTEKPESFGKRALVSSAGFLLRHVGKSLVIGTQPLAKALTTLALGDGEPLAEGTGIESNGRLIRNTGLRKIAGI